jgi:single-stranded-DNA-specific exonuclease
MTTRWIYKEIPEFALDGEADTLRDKIDKLSAAIHVSPVIASMLVQRGICTFEEAYQYFRPSLDDLHSPYLMEDMEKAMVRILQAMQHKEKILIYGDYDVDGITSVSLVYGFLRNFYGELNFYIPDRYKEGYGISSEGIEWARDNGYTLLISLDCGIKAVEMTDYAGSFGIDLIICDHHLPGDVLPRAHAILDPKLPGCAYPYKELSGCGVGFKLLQAFCDKKHLDPDLLYDYLDLVAVSIAADIVPMMGENRILAFHGLKKLNESPRLGLEVLLRHAGIKDEINVSSIVFGIGPRINASGRMDHAKNAVELLLADDYKEVDMLAESLDTHNLNRRTFDTNTTNEALEMIAANDKVQMTKSTVLFKDDWHKGVIGIVASRCIDKYYRPTIILTQSNGKATGSARSVDGFDIYEAIAECADLLDQYGGHRYAAGLTLKVDNIAAFKAKFEQIVAARITEEQTVPMLEIDGIIDLSDITPKFYDVLRQMAPFGPGNLQPVFVTERLRACGRPRILKGQHLKFNVVQDDDEEQYEAIGFGLAQYFDLVASGMPFSMAYSLEENNYMGNTALQMRVRDIKFD